MAAARTANSPADRTQVKEWPALHKYLLWLGQRMQVADEAFQALFQDMSIDLRG